MINLLKKQEGITLITLVITVVLLIIITVTITINVHTSFELSKLTKLENDIKILNDRVAAYYVANEILPVTEETYTKSELEDIITGISINDGNTYYTIDLSKLSNITLNYGKKYADEDLLDKYIINQDTHNIYYLNGVEYQGEKYYTLSHSNEVALTDYVAELAASRVTVTFNAIGGTIPANNNWRGSGETATKFVNIGSTYGDLPTPTRAGYTFLGWNKNNNDYILPSEYQEVEYIKFNTNSFIDTGLIPTNHTTDIKFDYETYTSDEFLLGTSRDSGYYYTSSYNNKYVFGHDGNKGWTGYGTWTTGIHHLIYNGENNSIILDDEILESGYGISSTTNLWIGKRQSTANLSGKVYYVKITDKSTGRIVRNFIPCYRTSDNVIGLYDVVNGMFYTNSGTGTLDKGENVVTMVASSTQIISREEHTLYAMWGHNPTVTFDANGGSVNLSSKTITYNSNYGDLPTPTREGYTFLGWTTNNNYYIPSEYQEVEYIQFNIGNYIDTGIIPINHMTEVKFDFNEYNNDEHLFGTNISSSHNYYHFTSYSNKYYWGRNGSEVNAGSWTTGEHTLTFNGENNSVVLDDSILGSGTNITSSANLLLGNRGGAANLQAKVYAVKITDKSANNIVRYMIPCYRKNDGATGLYDSINGEFYINAGSGSFSRGNNVNSSITSSSRVIINNNHTLYAAWQSLYNRKFIYTGSVQEYEILKTGYYKIEAYGAGGGQDRMSGSYFDSSAPGGFASGVIKLNEGEKIYVYVGEKGDNGIISKNVLTEASFNGGGAGIGSSDGDDGGGAGGGATDIRLVNGAWDDFTSLKSRILVAGGGSGGATVASGFTKVAGGLGGGLTATGSVWRWQNIENKEHTYNAKQTSGYKFRNRRKW